jgi:hypothetical protein
VQKKLTITLTEFFKHWKAMKELPECIYVSSKIIRNVGVCLCCHKEVLNLRKKPRIQSTVNSFLSATALNYWTDR